MVLRLEVSDNRHNPFQFLHTKSIPSGVSRIYSNQIEYPAQSKVKYKIQYGENGRLTFRNNVENATR